MRFFLLQYTEKKHTDFPPQKIYEEERGMQVVVYKDAFFFKFLSKKVGGYLIVSIPDLYLLPCFHSTGVQVLGILVNRNKYH